MYYLLSTMYWIYIEKVRQLIIIELFTTLLITSNYNVGNVYRNSYIISKILRKDITPARNRVILFCT